MAVRADECLSGDAEALKMYLMADAVSGAREANAVLLTYRLNISVVVCILKSGLKCVMIYVCNGKLRLYSWNADSLKLKVCHRSRSVLSESLVYSECYLLANLHLT